MNPASLAHHNAISPSLTQLRACTQVDIQSGWLSLEQGKFREQELQGESFLPFTFLEAVSPYPTSLNAKGHIAWPKGKRVLWLVQKLAIAQELNGYPLEGLCLRLALTWWAELARIYVNGQLVQEGDLFDCSTRLLLSPSVTPGEEITVALQLVSPAHDDGALVRSLLVYESNDDDRLEPGFVADELAVLQSYLETFAPEKLPILAAAVAEIDWLALPDREKFERSLLKVRSSLQFLSPELKQRQMQLLGHAHLDLAWLWAVSETWSAAQRTFTSVLNLQQQFPELVFCHSTPALYAWIEQHRPDLFASIQQQVKAGRWEVVGGLWVEPELNIISGESIVRQLLYGQRYVLEKFGNISTVAWLPDSFGFCATLPQFLANGGIEYFVTQKLRWNDTTEFPHGAFWWRSPDGTDLFSLMSPPIGEAIEPLKMASYLCNWSTQTHLQQVLWLPGVGDHGGGPTRDMLEVARRWQKSPFFPQIEFTTAENYLQHIKSQEKSEVETLYITSVQKPEVESQKSTPSARFPVWQDELYLEFHRGCYTTHADQKRWNRRCEGLLYQAELFASLATLSAGLAYPKIELETAWKQVLFNQFHDILPGSAIPEVYEDANRDWQEAEQTATDILQKSLRAIASQIAFPTPPHPEAQPIVVFNSLNWERSELVTIELPEPKHNWQNNFDWQICNSQAQEIQFKVNRVACRCNSPMHTMSFLASVPAVGYRVFWLYPFKTAGVAGEENKEEFVLENEYLRVTVDSSTGDLSSVFDLTHQREVLSGAGNQLQAFQDRGQYWDAWNIDPNYAQHPLPPAELLSIDRKCDRVQTCVNVTRKIGSSTFYQDYILEKGSPILKIKTTVDWQERQVLVKAAFKLNLESEYATYEIPCGAITRSTQPQTEAEKAKWEVPALQWADLSADDYGVSLLNDCKYGYDSQSNQLRLTLLRSASWPNPQADRGWHEFTYALYPHAGTWQSAGTVRRGYELNLPLQVMLLPSVSDSTAGQLSPVSRLLDLSADNLILMAFKQSEDDRSQFIIRCYECHGDTAQLSLHSDLGLSIVQSVDLLERSLLTAENAERSDTSISPWKIATFQVTRLEPKGSA
ncbi:MAG TPA: alpha-mannosidase [Cyanobacteria bacterium UBA11049]|nr:alpha-mannosidase [Cyanobacteria bacterium UBA11049]